MKLNIQRWGNSAAIRLPAAFLAQIGARVGDVLEVDPQAMKLARPSYSLSDMIAQCDKDAPPPADLAAWEKMPAVGREVV